MQALICTAIGIVALAASFTCVVFDALPNAVNAIIALLAMASFVSAMILGEDA